VLLSIILEDDTGNAIVKVQRVVQATIVEN
jgi:hypothetical protein